MNLPVSRYEEKQPRDRWRITAVTTPIRLGISTCPNDTFTFHGLMTRAVDWRGLDFDIALIDIQQLNDGLFKGTFDVAKASFHAALLLANKTVVLPSGSALGFGVGPLLLSAKPDIRPSSSSQLTLCPGRHTTATLLFELFHAGTTKTEQVVFSEIMPKLQRGEAEFGVCIHEGRFTWQDQGLGLVEDLGTRWETETECPLPLGGIIAQRVLPPATIATVQAVIQDSLDLALADPAAALPSMRQYAQEFDDAILKQHVDLYVNEWTRDLGDVGRNALRQLSERAFAIGLAEDATTAIEATANTRVRVTAPLEAPSTAKGCQNEAPRPVPGPDRARTETPTTPTRALNCNDRRPWLRTGANVSDPRALNQSET